MRLVDANQVLHRQSNSLSEEAYSKIRSMIISLDLEPGSLINEAELMVRLGFSRTPIREPLRSLPSEHLEQVCPRRGMCVPSGGGQFLTALY